MTHSVGIAIEHLHKRYGSVAVLRDASLSVEPGSFVALLGPSGCGKTTLLRSIAGLDRPDSGVIRIGDRAVVDIAAGVMVPPQARRLGMVFQHYALWPHMTVRQNIAYPLRKQKVARAEWETRIGSIAELVGLSAILERRPAQLSGGQQQRVALARALVSRPSVLLLDEPLSNLDANLRNQLRRELRQIHDRQGATTILVTHDQEEAATLADRIAVVDRGEIVQVGSPAMILDRPVSRFVATFVGYDNFLLGRVSARSGREMRVRFAGGGEFALEGQAAAGAAVTIAARSDRIALCGCGDAPEGNGWLRGRVLRVQGLGRWHETSVDCNGAVVVVRSQASPPAEVGEMVALLLPGDAAVLAES